MKIIANRQLYNSSYGSLRPDEAANIPDYIASDLLKRGLVRIAPLTVVNEYARETQSVKTVQHSPEPALEVPVQVPIEQPTAKIATKTPLHSPPKGK